ncbi:MAG: hypothetical protein N2200_06055 [Bacteroidia bacterium]|nr:hypothetical protein [Bacteroidia bacterium]
MSFLIRFIYTMGWVVGIAVIPILALFNEKVRRWWRARTASPPEPPLDRPVFWLHCASVGEFEQGRPVIEYILEKLSYKPYLVVTFFSASGWQRYKGNSPLGDWIGPAPTDTPWVVRRWVKRLKPQVAFFVKYDLWPNLLHELKTADCAIYLLAAHVTPLKGLRWWWKKQLFPYIDRIFVQTETDVQKLRLAGFSKVTVAGDSRLVRVKQLAENWLPVSGVHNWLGNGFAIVAGSVWEADVQFLAKAYEQLRGYSVRWILAPHEVSPKQIEYIHRTWPVKCIQYSHSEWESNRDTLILDTMGLLAYVYFYADAVWIGGGFGRGIHNILEAAIYKKPIFFGPNYQDFSEARELIALKIAESCKYPVSFSNAIKSLIKDRRRMHVIAEKAAAYIASKPETPEIVWNELKNASWALPAANQAIQEGVG